MISKIFRFEITQLGTTGLKQMECQPQCMQVFVKFFDLDHIRHPRTHLEYCEAKDFINKLPMDELIKKIIMEYNQRASLGCNDVEIDLKEDLQQRKYIYVKDLVKAGLLNRLEQMGYFDNMHFLEEGIMGDRDSTIGDRLYLSWKSIEE
jgi:hypothetical protein